MNAVRILITTLSFSSLCIGCSGSTDTGQNGDVFVGTYDVVTANGSPLPVAIFGGGGPCTTTGIRGALTPTQLGRFTATYTYRHQCGSSANDVSGAIAGHYTINGSDIVFTADSGINKRPGSVYVVTGTVSGGTVTLQNTVFGTSVSGTLVRR